MPVLTAGQSALGAVGTRTFKLRLTAAGKRLANALCGRRLTAEGTFAAQEVRRHENNIRTQAQTVDRQRAGTLVDGGCRSPYSCLPQAARLSLVDRSRRPIERSNLCPVGRPTRDSYERATGRVRRFRFEPTEQEPTPGPLALDPACPARRRQRSCSAAEAATSGSQLPTVGRLKSDTLGHVRCGGRIDAGAD